jgi:putative transposase
MLRFRQMKNLQKFASVHASVHKHFGLERHVIARETYEELRSVAPADSQKIVKAKLPSSKTQVHRVESG